MHSEPMPGRQQVSAQSCPSHSPWCWQAMFTLASLSAALLVLGLGVVCAQSRPAAPWEPKC